MTLFLKSILRQPELLQVLPRNKKTGRKPGLCCFILMDYTKWGSSRLVPVWSWEDHPLMAGSVL